MVRGSRYGVRKNKRNWLTVEGPPSSEKSKNRSDAAKSIAGSEARMREEVMPGKTSGEVMLLRRREKDPVLLTRIS